MVAVGGSIHKPVWVPNEVTGRSVLNRLLGRELVEPSPNIKIEWMSFISVSLTFSVVLLSILGGLFLSLQNTERYITNIPQFDDIVVLGEILREL